VENVKFRLVGVPPDVAGQLIDIDFDQDIESANRNDYEQIDRNIDLEKDNIFLVFQNKNNKKFISAWVDEEGFATEELENL